MFSRTFALWFCFSFLIPVFSPTPAQHIRADVSHSKPVYERATVVTVRGLVMDVAVHRCSMGWKNRSNVTPSSTSWEGLHVFLDTPYGRIDAHLGPTWFLKTSGLQVTKGDFVEVTGSKFLVDGRFVLIAREVSKEKRTIFLRDIEGTPLWLDGVANVQSLPPKPLVMLAGQF